MRYHNRPVLAAYYAQVICTAFYLIFHPWVVMFNPETRRLEPSRLWRPVTEARPDPMTTGLSVASADDTVASTAVID